MRHRKSGTKLNKPTSHRNAMLRNMVTSLFKYEQIHTTDTRAKALRGWADHLISLAKRGDLHARRQALAIVREEAVVHKLFAEAKDRFGASKGGYTRIAKLGIRAGDAAAMSLIALVGAGGSPAKPSGKKARAVKPQPGVPVKVPAVADDAIEAQAGPSTVPAPVAEVAAEALPETPASGQPSDEVGRQSGQEDAPEKA